MDFCVFRGSAAGRIRMLTTSTPGASRLASRTANSEIAEVNASPSPGRVGGGIRPSPWKPGLNARPTCVYRCNLRCGEIRLAPVDRRRGDLVYYAVVKMTMRSELAENRLLGRVRTRLCCVAFNFIPPPSQPVRLWRAFLAPSRARYATFSRALHLYHQTKAMMGESI